MKNPAFKRLLFAALLAIASVGRVKGQEFLVWGRGGMHTPSLMENSYSFEYFGYRHYFNSNFAVSTSWLNEGHVTGHHRDGTSFQLWANLPLDDGRWAFAVGVGPYYYFDTVFAPGGSADIHGTALMLSLTATYYPLDDQRLFLRATATTENPRNDIRVDTVNLGVGVWLGHNSRPIPGQQLTPERPPRLGTSEVTILGGWSVENKFGGEHRFALATEYRWAAFDYFDATVTLIDETTRQVARRRGIGLQGWPTAEFALGKLELGVGVGIYTAVGPRNSFAPGQYFTPIVSPYFSVEASWKLNDRWRIRTTWNRVTGYESADSDVWMFGLGCRL